MFTFVLVSNSQTSGSWTIVIHDDLYGIKINENNIDILKEWDSVKFDAIVSKSSSPLVMNFIKKNTGSFTVHSGIVSDIKPTLKVPLSHYSGYIVNFLQEFNNKINPTASLI